MDTVTRSAFLCSSSLVLLCAALLAALNLCTAWGTQHEMEEEACGQLGGGAGGPLNPELHHLVRM